MNQDIRVVDTPAVYIPIDRRIALAREESLPAEAQGTALFADISGFTPLTEALTVELGPKRGAEELTVHLNQVYGALIAELHRFGGSVISFSGDAITCWLDGDDGRRGVAAALAMQQAMGQFAAVSTISDRIVSLGMKVAVAAGPVRRFVVGDPAYQRIDTMAGETLEKLAAAEHLIGRGEIALDETAVANLNESLSINKWRTDPETGLRFAVVDDLALEVSPSPWPDSGDMALDDEVKEAWLLPRVYERLNRGLGEFLAEIRPVYSLFLRFTGIDYDGDPEAPAKLDNFIREAQRVFIRLDGSMTSLTIGDKGSYFSVAFGAPVAHEDDAVRAAATALALHDLANGLPYLEAVQIGITSGRVRSGAYGSMTRRAYSVIGDPVNLSARLMAAANPGQSLAEEAVKVATGDRFLWESLPNLRVKGKRDLVAVSRLVGQKKARSTSRLEPQYQLPMVGRAEELALIQGKIDAARSGEGQIVAITAEAGMGKSRLAAEAIRAARESGLTDQAGECQSYGTTSSYLVWQGVWRGFFDLDPAHSLEAQVASLETQLAQLDPALLPRLPLLGVVLNLAIPDNDLTRSLDAKVRKSSLEDLLLRLLEARTRIEPLMLVLEDCHWLDDLSRELIAVIGRGAAKIPVLLLLVYRPPDRLHQQAPPVENLPHFTQIPLTRFSDAETRRLIELKLAQMMGEETAVPQALLARVTAQALGNPFYVEELLNYFQDVGVDLQDPDALQAVDLPNSLYSLVLSRIDQLDETEQLTIKIASVIGRLFRAAMLWGVYPELPLDQVQHNLDVLSHLELTPLDTPLPELAYLFKHIVTQQVAYESLLHSTRAMLHEQIGLYTERTYPDTLEEYTDLLAFHFEQSDNDAKKREYLLKAGEAAQKDYANAAAITYFEKSLPLLEEQDLIDTRIKLGKVFELGGSWDEAVGQYEAALEEANEIDNQEKIAWSQSALGELWLKRSRYDTAEKWFVLAQEIFEAHNDKAGVGHVLHFQGTLAAHQGEYELASQRYNRSLSLRRELGDREQEASLYSNLGIVARRLGNPDRARRYYEDSLTIRESLGERWAIAVSLNNLGNLAIDSEDYTNARHQLERALLIWREIGERWAMTNTIHNLANVAREERDFQQAERLYAESIGGWRELDDRWGISYWLEDTGLLQLRLDRPQRAMQLMGAGTALREQIGAPRPPAYDTILVKKLFPARQALGEETADLAMKTGQALELDEAIELALAINNGESQA